MLKYEKILINFNNEGNLLYNFVYLIDILLCYIVFMESFIDGVMKFFEDCYGFII